MKKRLSLFFPLFLILIVFLSSCAPNRFSSRRYSRERVTVEANRKEKTTTAKSYETATENSPDPFSEPVIEPATPNVTVEKIEVPSTEIKTPVTREEVPVTQTGKDHKILQHKLKKSREILKTTETNRSVVWLSYGIASFVLGFLGLAMIPLAIFVHPVIFAIIGLSMAILAVVFGIMGLKAKRLRFLPIMGLIMGALGVVGWIVIIILLAIGTI
jgi:hypothetical protein